MSANPRADHQWQDKILRRERFADFAYTLARIDWQFFTTHTFKNPMPRQETRLSMFYRWKREVSKFSGTPQNRLLVALRGELGEQGGRPHFHSLLGGVNTCNIMATRSQLFRAWLILSNGADCDFRIYDRSLAGADYICKCLGANAYEVNKFSLAEETTLSESVFHVVRILDEMSDRRCGKLSRKYGQVAKATGHKPSAQHDSGVILRPASVPPGLPGASSIRDKTASPMP
jgi:hypothetical protein